MRTLIHRVLLATLLLGLAAGSTQASLIVSFTDITGGRDRRG